MRSFRVHPLRRHFRGELLESRYLLSAVSFVAREILESDADGPQSVYAADVDSDGDVDVLSASLGRFGDDKIAWYENTDGVGTFGPQQVITTDADIAVSVHAADVDGDGDVDVLSASGRDNKIAWYENTDGAGRFGSQQVITTEAGDARSVYAADVDGDSDVDVLSASSDDKIAWYENTDGAKRFGPQQMITTEADGSQSVYAADVDGDVLSASFRDDKIAWYENTDGAGSFGPQQVISTDAVGARSVYSADLDGDGDLDVLSASARDGKIVWYENHLAGDVDENGKVDFADFLILSANFGRRAADSRDGDLNGDGEVAFADFTILAENFGKSC